MLVDIAKKNCKNCAQKSKTHDTIQKFFMSRILILLGIFFAITVSTLSFAEDNKYIDIYNTTTGSKSYGDVYSDGEIRIRNQDGSYSTGYVDNGYIELYNSQTGVKSYGDLYNDGEIRLQNSDGTYSKGYAD